jgi:FixJ family two-component response regulator
VENPYPGKDGTTTSKASAGSPPWAPGSLNGPITFRYSQNVQGQPCERISVGLHARLFASVADFLGCESADCATCLVLDVRLPGQSGLDFQRDLAAASVRLPIVFMTGHGDIPMSVQAMKAGAIEFLTKPFRDQDLLDAVNVGLARDRARRENEETLSALRARVEVLTSRERAILTQVAEGRLNKQIAGDLGITETTVKVHRSNAMRKIKAASLAELYRMVDKLKLLAESSEPS